MGSHKTMGCLSGKGHGKKPLVPSPRGWIWKDQFIRQSWKFSLFISISFIKIYHILWPANNDNLLFTEVGCWFDHSAQCPPIPYTWRGIMESPWTPRCSPGRKKYANTASDFYFRKYLSTQLKYSMTNTECFYLSHVIVKQGPTRHRPMAHPVVLRYVSFGFNTVNVLTCCY